MKREPCTVGYFHIDYESPHKDGPDDLEPPTGVAADDRKLDQVSGRRLFAVAWQDVHGPEAFYRVVD